MTTPNVLAFESDGSPIEFAVWLDDLQLFLLTDAKEGVSLFDYVSGTAVAPTADAPALKHSQWQTRDAAARLAIRNHLPITERAHFSQHRIARTLYDAIVARYSSPATAAIGRLMLPYLFPDLSSFTTAEDLLSHLRFRAALLAEDHFLALDPTTLTVDNFEKHLLAVDKNILAVGAARGTPRSPLFEGCSPSPLTPSYASAAAAHNYQTPTSHDAWRAKFPDAPEFPTWADLLRHDVFIFDLDYEAILAAMYALSVSAEVPQSLPSLHLFLSHWLTPLGAKCLHGLPLCFRVRRSRLVSCLVSTSPRSLRTCMWQFARAPTSPSSQPPPNSALRQVLSLPSSTGLPLQPGSPLPAPSPYTEHPGGLEERCEPASRPVSPVSSGRRVPSQSQPAVSGPPLVVRRPSSLSPRVPLPPPPASSLPVVADPASDRFRAEHSTFTRFLATVVSDPSFESAAASTLVTELVAFAAHCRLDYAASLVAESASVCPPSVGGECALGTDVFEDRQEDLECLAAVAPHLVSMLLAPEGDPDAPDIPTLRSYAEAIAGEYSSQWQTTMDAEMASWKSTGTYIDEVPPLGANIVSGMWIFRVKRPLGSPPVFKARYVARGFSQREGVDFFKTFSPTLKMTTLRVLPHVAVQRDYELYSLDFSTAFLQGNLHEEIWLRRPPGFTGSFPPGTQRNLRRPVYGLCEAPLLVYVDDLVFATADTEALALVKSELQKRHTCTDLAPPSDESVEPSGPYPELVGCLMYLMTCTRPDLAYPLGLLARYVAPGRHQKVHMDAAKRVLRYLCNTSGMGLVLGGRGDVVLTGHSDASWVHDQATQRSCEAEIYTTAMAAQELRWLTYLLPDLGERPRSPPVLYVDNKAAIALCQEHRLEQRTKHIALRYFLAREWLALHFLPCLVTLLFAYGALVRILWDPVPPPSALPSSSFRTLAPVTPVSSPSACRASPSRSLAPIASRPSIPSRRVALARPVQSRRACPSRPVPSRRACPPCRARTVPSRPRPLRPAPCPSAPVAPCPSASIAPCPSAPVAPCLSCWKQQVLRFDAGGRPLEFSVWLLRAQRLLESHVQADESLWAHASGDLRAPPDHDPLGADPTTEDRDRFARQHAALTAWKSRDAAACITLSSLLPEFEETHFT
ncbi:unnamed protein product [Closterium sp. NIES-53]